MLPSCNPLCLGSVHTFFSIMVVCAYLTNDVPLPTHITKLQIVKRSGCCVCQKDRMQLCILCRQKLPKCCRPETEPFICCHIKKMHVLFYRLSYLHSAGFAMHSGRERVFSRSQKNSFVRHRHHIALFADYTSCTCHTP